VDDEFDISDSEDEEEKYADADRGKATDKLEAEDQTGHHDQGKRVPLRDSCSASRGRADCSLPCPKLSALAFNTLAGASCEKMSMCSFDL